MPNLPFIPEFITVHLGAPDASAPNVTVSFPDYVANVASSEIYPTWPENAIRANIYAQISFALNRVYTEFYRSRGYDFDITSYTGIDQAYVKDRDIFENVAEIAYELFNDYLKRPGSVEPLFAQYCNGTTVTCGGLSQWGSVELANRGYTPYEILTYYFGDELDIVYDAPVRGITASYPYRALRLGLTGNDVKTVQLRLNRISNNYPSIPHIPNTGGFYDTATESAVIEFQRIFALTADGVTGKATWYKIQYVYNGVKRLSELDSEGLTLGEVSRQFPGTLSLGDSGIYVLNVQYFLDFVSQYRDEVPPIALSRVYDEATRNSVTAFQRLYGLAPDGIMGEQTYYTLFDAYEGIIESLPDDLFVSIARPAPAIQLGPGYEGEEVRYLQEYLNVVASEYPELPTVTVNGIYDEQTTAAVRAFQQLFGISTDNPGYTAAVTWNAIGNIYDDILAGEEINPSQYPGIELGRQEV